MAVLKNQVSFSQDNDQLQKILKNPQSLYLSEYPAKFNLRKRKQTKEQLLEIVTKQNDILNKILEKNGEEKKNKVYQEKIRELKKYDDFNKEIAEVKNMLIMMQERENKCMCGHPPPPPPHWFMNYGIPNYSQL